MNFNNHSSLDGRHAFLGASKYHWINYDELKVAESYSKFLATRKGTILHEFAAQCISLRQKLPKSQKTLNMYVNTELRNRLNRLQMEKQYAQLNQREKSAGAKFVTNVLLNAAQQTASKYVSQYMSKGVEALINMATKK